MSEKLSYRPVNLKRILALLSFFFLCIPGFTQIIRGIVLDMNTKAKINFASVYFNGTFAGTHTDEKGFFELDISGFRTMPLTISALGYYSINMTGLQPDKQYLVYLEPKIYELQEVVVTARGNWYEKKTVFFFFKREFLGSSINAAMCVIKNPDDIIINYKNKSDTLTAFSMNPILITNKSLGYNIIYYLDKFEMSYNSNYLLILGNYIFLEDTTKNENRLKRFGKRRALAYSGSRMHFFRALWENDLDSSGFTIKDSTNTILTYKDLVVQPNSSAGDEDLKYLRYKGNLYIAYHTKLPQTCINMLRDTVGFVRNGFFEPLGIGWQGEMSKQRTGDLLPFEYKVSKE